MSGEERRSASVVHTTEFTVEFGDCDPARIVFYPNFFRWMDSAARHYFEAAGLPSWRETDQNSCEKRRPMMRGYALAPITTMRGLCSRASRSISS